MNMLGVDIGGTKIAAGCVRLSDGHAICVDTITIETRATHGFAISIEQVWTAIGQAITKDVQAIGICAPGPLHQKTGVILNPPNLPGWVDIPLVEMTRQKLDCL